MRELLAMVEGRQTDQWLQTAKILLALHEPHRDPARRRQPYTLADFFPWPDRLPKPAEVPPEKRVGIEVLKIFLDPASR